MPIPLEDNFADVIMKAQRGLGLSDSVLASKSGVTAAAVQGLRGGYFDEEGARAVAPVLGLDARALVELGRNAYAPAEIGPMEGLEQFNTEFGDMTVNAYLVWDPAAKVAAAFDTGGDCGGMIERIDSLGLKLRYIFLTHTHGDHIFDLDRLRERTGAPAFVSSREPVEGAQPIEPGREFYVGALRVGTRLTWGHSRGGITWVVSGLRRTVAVVGDALFAGSMGGGMVSYKEALLTNRNEIFSLPDETVICPGHGPMTSVGEEKRHNPFFSGNYEL
jgi:glyoxylase-like metal-dependent hydrolase (beta-lactamase superfamily II)